MKWILSFLMLAFISTVAGAQSWEILNTELKVERLEDSLEIAFLDDRARLMVHADTAYLDPDLGLLVTRSGERYGLMDPWDLYEISKPEFDLVESFSYDLMLLRDSKGYFLAQKGDIEEELTPRVESIEPFESEYIETSLDQIFKVTVKGKQGLVYPDLLFQEYFLAPEYDEIELSHMSEAGPAFRIRKGDNWGIFSCEEICIEPVYDEVEYISGYCSGIYVVCKRGKCGIMQCGETKPAIPLKYHGILHTWQGSEVYAFLLDRPENSSGMVFAGPELEDLQIYDEYFLLNSLSTEKTYLFLLGDDGFFYHQVYGPDFELFFDGIIERVYID